MQHVDGRRHQAASIDIVLELASEAIPGSGFAHFVEEFTVFVQEIQTFRVLLACFVVKGKGLIAKAVLEQRANAIVTFRIVSRIGLAHLLRGTHPGKRLFRSHAHAVCIRYILFSHQLVFHQLHATAVSIVGQREIANTVEVGFTGQGVLSDLHVGIAQEHAGAASAPQERLLGCLNQRRNRFIPLFLFEVHKANTELGPLALDIILKAFVRKSPVADNGAIVLFLLFVFETLHPQVVGVFLAELVCILQGGIHLADFLFVTGGVIAVQAQNRLHPQGARFYRIQQELELLNGFIIALERAQCHCALFPQGNTGSHIQGARRKLFLQRIFGRRERRLRRKRDKHRIQNANGIQQSQAFVGIIFGASHPGISHLFFQSLGSATHLAQPTDGSESGILVVRGTRQESQVNSLCLFHLLELFQILGIAITQSRRIVGLRVLFHENLQRIRMGAVTQRRVSHRRLNA